MSRHRRGERVGRVDQMGEAIRANGPDQAIDAAEATDADRAHRHPRMGDAAGERGHEVDPGALQRHGQGTSLSRAAQYQNPHSAMLTRPD
jgi:hypothetical protein